MAPVQVDARPGKPIPGEAPQGERLRVSGRTRRGTDAGVIPAVRVGEAIAGPAQLLLEPPLRRLQLLREVLAGDRRQPRVRDRMGGDLDAEGRERPQLVPGQGRKLRDVAVVVGRELGDQ